MCHPGHRSGIHGSCIWFMQNIYFTPGPSQLYPTAKQHIKQALEDDIPSLSHRSDIFHDMVKQSYERMRKLFDIPETYHIFFTASATEGMERIIENCVNEISFHFVNGAFSKRFYQIALELKRNSQAVTAEVGKPFDFASISIPKNTELTGIAHNETSAGIAIPPEEIYKLRKHNPDSLIAVDIVSSAPYVSLDFSKLDCVFFSIQKGFGLPAGLGVLIVSPRAMKKALRRTKAGKDVGSYHKFETLLAQAQKYQTIETPNVLGIYLLNNILGDMLKKGIKTIRKETDEKAKLVYDFLDNHPTLQPLVTDKIYRSKTVIVIDTPKGSGKMIAELKKHGFVVGAGYGDLKERQIRIANFPAHTLEHMKNLLKHF